MPGGFTSSGANAGYQSVDDPEPTTTPRRNPPAPATQPTNAQTPNAPGAYQSV